MSLLATAAGDLLLLEPWLLLLALALPLLLLRRRPPALRIAGLARLRPLPATWRVRLRGLPHAFEAAGLLCAVVALARPAVRAPLPEARRGIDLLLCLDVSSSMAAHDLDPDRSRLEIARAAAADFVRGRPDDRIGLIRFARFPELLSPPTLDHGALLTLLSAVEPVAADSEEDATGIGGAVARAAQVLRSSAAKSKVAVVLTDGEENVYSQGAPDEIAPLHAAQLCAAVGVRADTIHVAPDPAGADTGGASSLARLAARTGGASFEARDAAAIAGVYRKIDALERDEVAPPRFRFDDRFAPFVAAAGLLVLAGRLLAGSVLEALP